MLSKQKMKELSIYLLGKEVRYQKNENKYKRTLAYSYNNNDVSLYIQNNKAKLTIKPTAKNNGKLINTVVNNINILQEFENKKIKEFNNTKRWLETRTVAIKEIVLEFDVVTKIPKLEILTVNIDNNRDHREPYYSRKHVMLYSSNLCEEIFLPTIPSFIIIYKNNKLNIQMFSLKEKDIEIIGEDFLIKNDLQSKLEVVEMFAI